MTGVIEAKLRTLVALYFVRVKDQPKLATRYKIMASPTFILFSEGIEKTRAVGQNAHEGIRKILQET